MTRADLLALAERVERAEADDAALFLSALDALALPSQQHHRIVRFIEVGAYESAAASLVPKGRDWSVDDFGSGQGRGPVWPPPSSDEEHEVEAHAATPALALTAAALRARAAMMEDAP